MSSFSATDSLQYQFPNDPLDLAEAVMRKNFPEVECPLEHHFSPGLYTRVITMPAGTLISSRIHNTTHPFFVLSGLVSVWTENHGEVLLKAGHVGLTEPGTRRLLYIHETCRWATAHPCVDGETVEQIEQRILDPHVNPYLGETHWEISRQNPSFLNGRHIANNHETTLHCE